MDDGLSADKYLEIVRRNDLISINVFNIPEIRYHIHDSIIFPKL